MPATANGCQYIVQILHIILSTVNEALRFFSCYFLIVERLADSLRHNVKFIRFLNVAGEFLALVAVGESGAPENADSMRFPRSLNRFSTENG